MSNIYLIGFMGSGKTTIGNALSAILNFDFLDTDKEIEKRNLISIKDIFKTKGESFFRNEEAKIIKNIPKLKNTVIATGGGFPCFNNHIDILNSLGTTIYLSYDIETLYLRLKNNDNRPLINEENQKELKSYIKNLLSERIKTYNKSKHTILCNNLTVNEILREINSLIIS
jgi:shikimate kinase|tara:strand:+ start:311 stop:823 length:513 start_codon:yes stop_codon:yes gene_type:complete